MGVASIRRLIPFLFALATMLAAPAAASAEVRPFGSDLTAPANVVEAHGADSAFWNVSLANGGATAAPADGQVTSVRVKGMVLPDPSGRRKPLTMFHFQTIRPLPDGEMAVWLSSAAFYTPLGGDPQAINTYRPVNMCVHKGDYLDFNDIGGNEWWWGPYSGMPFQTFSRVPGSSVNFYSKSSGTNIGSHWRPAETKQGEELLMQMKLATGPDATDICPGGYTQHVYRGVDLRNGQTALLRGGSAKIRVTCHYENYGGCHGTVRASAVVNGRQVKLGSGGLDVTRGYTASVYFSVPGAAAQAAQRGGLKVRLTAVTRDDPRHDRRVRWGSVPVQTKVNAASVTLRAG
jgi:hypothetical protein